MCICDKYMYVCKCSCNICNQLIKLTHLHKVISLNPSLGKPVSNLEKDSRKGFLIFPIVYKTGSSSEL